MTRILLLGIVAIAIFVIAPRVGASRSVTVDPDRASSALLARTVFDVEDVEGEDVIDHRSELEESGQLEERRDDARDWAEDDE
ncbi:hypothetical protein STA3757_08930 [Stanieria sp. NIES-3757]|nr:hypothetical protein STA3757_08930 [Stanieria sp. NIES-3757]